MAFAFWTWKISLWNFGNWMWSYISSLLRSTRMLPAADADTVNKQLKSLDEQLDVEPKAGFHYSRDAQGQLISGGLTGIIELLENGTVLKAPYPGPEIESHILDIAKEADIYRRIGPHERLVRMLGHSRDGLVLEYMTHGDLKNHLQSHIPIHTSLKLKWAYQLAEAVDLLHRNGIIHCDIKPRNLLLDTCFNIKIIDFSGSSVDGSSPGSGEGTRFFLPRHWRDPPTVATDLFALGSTLYEIFEGTSPYEEITSNEVERLYTQKEFPDISHTICGQIIMQCWLSQFDSAADVQTAIQEIASPTVNAGYIPHRDGLDTAQDKLIGPLASP